MLPLISATRVPFDRFRLPLSERTAVPAVPGEIEPLLEVMTPVTEPLPESVSPELSENAWVEVGRCKVPLTTVLDRYGIAPHDLPPAVAIVVVTGVSQVLVLEDVLGVTTGHAETRELVERWIDEIELGPAGAGGGRRVR